MMLSDFDYDLPPELIARYPKAVRSQSRLLVLNKENGNISHKNFPDFISYLNEKDLLVLNNTRVIPARLWGQKSSGGKVEMLVEKILDAHRVLAYLRASKSPKSGAQIIFKNDIRFEVIDRCDELFELRCNENRSVLEVIEAIGEIPLPPYFHRAPDENDQERYQTIYAKEKGSVAAPTAGLHFDETIFSILKEKNIKTGFVTLHVGAGTFAPVRVQNIAEHKMHAEYIEVSQTLCEQIRKTKSEGGRIIAVGTTTARSLETVFKKNLQSFQGYTDIFITPGYEFCIVDGLITNFHLPESTLLMLVSALAGHAHTMRAYEEAVKERYRFYSYGDAMLIL